MTEENVQPEDSKLEEEETTLESKEVESNEELTKAQEVANNQKIRAEKAEKELKALKANKPEEKEETPKNTSGLSNEDLLALTDVKNKDDRKFLIEKAKEMGKTVEALQDDPYMQAALKTMSEERATADATNTGKSSRGSSGQTNEAIVEAMKAGKEVDPVKLAEAQMALRKKEVFNNNNWWDYR